MSLSTESSARDASAPGRWPSSPLPFLSVCLTPAPFPPTSFFIPITVTYQKLCNKLQPQRLAQGQWLDDCDTLGRVERHLLF